MLHLGALRLAAVVTMIALVGGAALSAVSDFSFPDGSGWMFGGALLIAAADLRADPNHWLTRRERKYREEGRAAFADAEADRRRFEVRLDLVGGALLLAAGVIQFVWSLFD